MSPDIHHILQAFGLKHPSCFGFQSDYSASATVVLAASRTVPSRPRRLIIDVIDLISKHLEHHQRYETATSTQLALRRAIEVEPCWQSVEARPSRSGTDFALRTSLLKVVAFVCGLGYHGLG